MVGFRIGGLDCGCLCVGLIGRGDWKFGRFWGVKVRFWGMKATGGGFVMGRFLID